jgi:hypothetical protein
MLLMSLGVFKSSSLRVSEVVTSKAQRLEDSKMGDYWRQVHAPNPDFSGSPRDGWCGESTCKREITLADLIGGKT